MPPHAFIAEQQASSLAYSYIRFSTPDQMSRDSLRRQLENGAAYAAEKGFHLVTDYRDLGVSAWKGKNAQEGRLAEFVRAAHDGAVPFGANLIVESLDRLYRQRPRLALKQFLELLELGIVIHTVIDRQVYSDRSVDTNPMLLFGSIMIMVRANEESETKSKRVLERKQQARQHAMDHGTIMTTQAPAWLEVVVRDGQRKFNPLPHRVKIIREIFQMSIDGIGSESILRILNERRVPSFSAGIVGKTENGWHKNYLRKILVTRAVCGDFERGGRLIVGYFPRVISEETWERAKAARLSRTKTGGPKGPAWNNLFSGVAVCAQCGGSLSVRPKGAPATEGTPRPPRHYFICETYKRGRGCRNGRNLEYAPVERGILDRVWQVADTPQLFTGNGGKIAAVTSEMDALKAEANRLQTRLDAFTADDSYGVTPALMQSLEKLGRRKADALQKHADLRGTLASLRSSAPPEEHLFTIRMLRDLALEGDFEARARINQGLREVVDAVVFAPPDHILVMLAGGRLGMEFTARGEFIRMADGAWTAHPPEWKEWLAKVSDRPGYRERKWRYIERHEALPAAERAAFDQPLYKE